MSGPTATVSGGRQFVQSPVTWMHGTAKDARGMLQSVRSQINFHLNKTVCDLKNLRHSMSSLPPSAAVPPSLIAAGFTWAPNVLAYPKLAGDTPELLRPPPWMHPRHRCPMRAVGIANIDGRVGLTWIHMGTKCWVTWITKLGAEPLEALRAPSHVSGPSPPEARRRRRCQR
ncbi:hypothetical protein B0H17DRAFT_1146642 [Mycena rosella]|uniref:Uncharacterized protein n=1 Tax=Mycena rosella TaxID=1033263 RepID=A0AAD7CNH0_MYCRO|nr:hypothetical protein B0H17DRAFT_1146642 [Mycena rosella]